MPSFRVLFTTLMLAALTACATPQSLKPGTTLDEARSALGRPTGTYPLPTGGTRLQYSNQPFDQSVWNVDFDAQGRFVRSEQVMTDAAFAQVRPGKDTREDVLRGFGVPAQTFDYRLVNESAWMYRYYTYGNFRAAMFVYFDPKGTVLRTEGGLDPWALGGSDRQ